jgi:hypothetical protein
MLILLALWIFERATKATRQPFRCWMSGEFGDT